MGLEHITEQSPDGFLIVDDQYVAIVEEGLVCVSVKESWHVSGAALHRAVEESSTCCIGRFGWSLNLNRTAQLNAPFVPSEELQHRLMGLSTMRSFCCESSHDS